MRPLVSGRAFGVVGRVVRPRRRAFAGVVVLMVLDAALNSVGIGMVLPVLQAVLQEGAVHPALLAVAPWLGAMSPDGVVVALATATILLFLLRAATSYLYVSRARGFAERLRMEWIDGIGRNYLLGRYGRLLSERQGELLNNWQTETTSAARFFMNYLSFLSTSLQALALVAIGLVVSWQVMLGTLAAGALALVALRRIAFGRAAQLGQEKLVLNQGMTANMAESLSNARELKLMGAESRRLAALSEVAARLRRVFVSITVHGEMPRIVAEVFAVVALMGLVLVTIVVLDRPASAVLPMLAFFLLVFYRLTTAGSQVVGARMRALNELHAVDLVQRLSEEAEPEPLDAGAPVPRLPGDIAFDGVAYAYEPGTPVLESVSFVIPEGSLTFLVGPSGSGKSTVLDLLMRLDAPGAGRITAGGADVRGFALRAWRGLFGYVSQDAALFNGTVRTNLLLARPEATEEQIARALRLAGADTIVDALPQGLDTPVGDRGFTLSGGQRKRIAIARALLVEPSILILDEATTSFEERMEREIIGKLRTTMPDLTILQVTHRLQTATSADHVIVLDRGRVGAEGRWEAVAPAHAMMAAGPAAGGGDP